MSFLLFAGDDYYPLGGARDFQGEYDTAEEAVKGHDPSKYEYDGGWANIFNTETKEIVRVFDRGNWYKSIEEWRQSPQVL